MSQNVHVEEERLMEHLRREMMKKKKRKGKTKRKKNGGDGDDTSSSSSSSSDDEGHANKKKKKNQDDASSSSHPTAPTIGGDGDIIYRGPTDGTTLPLQEFTLDRITPDSAITLFGKRHTGKSVGAKNILYHFRQHIDNILVMSGTEKVNDFYGEFVLPQYIYDCYDGDLLFRLRQRQQLMRQLVKAGAAPREETVAVVLDDLIGDPKVRNDEQLTNAFIMGRHYKIFLVMTSHWARGIRPTMRSNTDVVFVFAMHSGLQREALWEDYGSLLPAQVFYRILDDSTEDFGCLVMDMRTNSNNPLEVFYKYKFPFPPPTFRFGDSESWKQAHEEEEEELREVRARVSRSDLGFSSLASRVIHEVIGARTQNVALGAGPPRTRTASTTR